MHLKSITLRGFKSFPDRTRLEFAPGVSVVVGPNGSGKSNVTDAVLWAMGEQSPVAVRGQSMQDVIFGGAPGRQAAKAAEVELVLDNSDGTLDFGLPEVSIFRRLDRTGEGEYRIAGARCRLVDVIELLSDTGLGKEMHSVISQGRVESIVTSKPRDRRLLIEEAAGLGKHRKRRRRAQLKLARTVDNLDRALDVEREARSRLRPLKRQAEAAELHARLERQSLEARWELARDDARAQREETTQAEAASARARSQLSALEVELTGVAKRREAAETALAQRSAQREELSRRCFAARGAGERVGYRAEAVRAAVQSTESRVASSRDALAALRAQAEADAPDPEAAARMTALEASLAALEQDRRAELERDLAELEERRARAVAERERRSQALAVSVSARESVDAATDAVRQELRAAERAVEAARREAARVGGQLAAVNQFLRAHAGAAGGAAALAATLQVEPGYELALAAALDGRLGAAVVPDRAAGSTLLDRAGGDGGRALVARAGAGGAPRGASGPPVADADRLDDRVSGAEDALALARVLLADTWVVPDLEAVPDTFAGVAVTRAGRVWSGATRELRQAPSVGEDRVLSERNRRAELVRASEGAVQAEVAAGAALEGAAASLAGTEAESERALAEQRAAAVAREEAAEEERRILRLIDRRRAAGDEGPAADRRTQLLSELASERRMAERAERERVERVKRIERLELGAARDEALVPVAVRLADVLDQAAAAISARVAEFEAALAEDREAGEHVTSELRACAQAEAELQSRMHAANEAVTAAAVRAQQARDRAAEAEASLWAVASALELEPEPATEPLPDREREALAERVERLARRREQLGPVNPLAQEEYAEAVEHVEELEHQREDLETALRELEKLIAETDRQIRETFEETFEAAARNFEELAAQLFPGGRGRLRLVNEREGPRPVLGGQPLPATEDGSGDGGSGEDEEPDEEPREDLDGVEIEVTPAGKEMKRLTLLSGGEKSMTALAFLFAVFLARPCPFYILDEVEAALDDLNIDRFLALLGRYSSRAQFIVVTHQKRTMEAADTLYGVSMGSDGISKVISRRLPRPADATADAA
ncbi:MAG TPA: AAA family ATPase [Solirubrobacteraceae bacterium]|nr:AAA family ATPase [Solirubrobacteraceae bacterium]